MLDVLDIHTHTTASGHAYNTIYEMAQSASRKGLALLGISDHGPAMEGSASKHYFRSSRCIPRELYGVKILFGCELNIMDYDGGVDLDEVFAGALDYGIASLHDVCITPGSRAENTRAYLKASGHFIGHIMIFFQKLLYFLPFFSRNPRLVVDDARNHACGYACFPRNVIDCHLSRSPHPFFFIIANFFHSFNEEYQLPS